MWTQAAQAGLAGTIAAVAMFSVVLGSVLGLLLKPRERIVANILAFGAGALINALAVDLAYGTALHLKHALHISGFAAWSYVAGGFVVGGLFYFFASGYIDARGGAPRHPYRMKMMVLAARHAVARSVAAGLSRVGLLRALTPAEFDELLPRLDRVCVAGGALILRQGDPVDGVYFLVEGQVRVLHDTARTPDLRDDTILAVLGPGDVFGELELLGGSRSSSSVQALGDCVLMRLGRDDFEALVGRSPALREALVDLDAKRLAANIRATPGDERRWTHLADQAMGHITRSQAADATREHGEGSPLALWLGNVLDAIPGSIVIGATFTSMAQLELAFLGATFVANLPESMASADTMGHAGYSPARIVGLWGSLVLLAAVMGALGQLLFADASPQVLGLAEAIAGGAILALVAQVMMPHAFEGGGRYVSLSTIAGFLTAFLLSTVGIESP
jgi:CRP-like cAMP-binding protein